VIAVAAAARRRGRAASPPPLPPGAPTITGLSALAAPLELTTGVPVPLVIYGTNFALAGGSTVTVGGVSAAVTVRNAQRAELNLPAGVATGVRAVVLTTALGSASANLTILAPEPALPASMLVPQNVATSDFCWSIGDVPDYTVGSIISPAPTFRALFGSNAVLEPAWTNTAVLDVDLPTGLVLEGILVRQAVGGEVSFPNVRVVTL
jgi:hypothetical protein